MSRLSEHQIRAMIRGARAAAAAARARGDDRKARRHEATIGKYREELGRRLDGETQESGD